jgi:hypothetical protein
MPTGVVNPSINRLLASAQALPVGLLFDTEGLLRGAQSRDMEFRSGSRPADWRPK